MQQIIDWTYLPWNDQGMAGTVCWACVIAGLLGGLVLAVLRYTRLGYDIHVSPFWTAQGYVYALAVNTAMCALFFWYAALIISVLFSTVCVVSARGVQKGALHDEKNGMWGLDPELRKVRGEMFSDLPEHEQVERKKDIEAAFKKTNPIPFYLITVCVPFAIMLILYGCGAGYIFVPHAL